tara:strand:+ start:42 stop:407 length:366 start_codon:yes stop_codon:yes gene_type:complete
LSHNLPISKRANTVPDTARIIEFHFCDGVKPRSLTTSGIKGTIPNQAKKHKKNAKDVIQNVFIGILLKSLKFNFVALLDIKFSIFVGLKNVILKCLENKNKYKYVYILILERKSIRISVFL